MRSGVEDTFKGHMLLWLNHLRVLSTIYLIMLLTLYQIMLTLYQIMLTLYQIMLTLYHIVTTYCCASPQVTR